MELTKEMLIDLRDLTFDGTPQSLSAYNRLAKVWLWSNFQKLRVSKNLIDKEDLMIYLFESLKKCSVCTSPFDTKESTFFGENEGARFYVVLALHTQEIYVYAEDIEQRFNFMDSISFNTSDICLS